MTELSVNTGSGEEAAPTQRVARWWEPLLGALSVATASVVTTITMLHLWTHNLRIPLAYGPTGRVPYAFAGDANFYVMLTKSLIDHGSYLHNSSLGAPYSQTLYDLPHGADNLQFLALRILGWLLRDPVLTVNIWWLTSFALVAATAYVALRCLGVSATVAWVLALLYSLLPYHFARGTAHLLLSSYFMVPIAVLLIVRVLGDAPPLVAPTATGGHRFSVRGRTSLLTLLACAGLASTGPYYALLSLVLLVCAVVVHIRRNGAWNWAPAMSAAAIAMTVGLVLAINLAPSLIYWARHGTNSRVANRPVSDTEVLGLKIARLVEPVDGHRIPALATIAAHGGDSPIPSERGQQLGLIGAVGFVGLVAAGLGTLISGRRRDAVHEDSDADRAPEAIPLLAGLTLLAVLLGTIGGFAVLLSKVGLSEIRSWNRISVFIGFLCFAAVGLWLDHLHRRVSFLRRTPAALYALSAILAVGGILDQVSPAYVPEYGAISRQWHNDDRFAKQVEAALPANSMVYVLPWVTFPEAGLVGKAGPYDGAIGWLHTQHLRWSWGSMRGRDGDWQEALVHRPFPDQLDGIAAVGFSGIWLDLNGPGGATLNNALQTSVGPPALQSDDGRFSFYDLRPYAAGQRDRLGNEAVARLRAVTLGTRTN